MRSSMVFVSTLLAVSSFKILVWNPQYGHSHSNFQARIADVLVDAGHNVTSLIPIIDATMVDPKTKSNKIYVAQGASTAEFMNGYGNQKMNMFEINNFNPFGALFLGHLFSSMFGLQCRAVLEEKELIERLREEKYDVMIMENTDMCGTALTHLVKPKSYILTSSSMVFAQQIEEFGVPSALSYNPEGYMSKMDVHSMWDRLVNIYANLLIRYCFGSIRWTINALFKEKFGPAFPSVLEISSNAAYIFVNSEPLIDFASPTMPKVVYIGGIGAKKPEKLSKDWDVILNKRENNVLLSFGSMAKSAYLSMPIKMSIIETVKSLPHVTFIWKYEEDDDFTRNVASKIPNLHLAKWMPQVDLLSDPRLSTFITHGGMGSTQETAQTGIPGIFVPLFGDQMRNALMMEHNGIGKVLNKQEVADPVKFAAVIREVIENESYRMNAKRVSSMLHKKPFSFGELIVKHTEFAAEFGPSKALRPQSHDMSWVEYHNTDIIIAGISAVLITIAMSLKLAKKTINGLIRISKIKKE